MKRIAVVLTIALTAALARADDASDLAALQPLSEQEQALYDKAKTDPGSLHEFVVTRTWARMIEQALKRHNIECGTTKMEIDPILARQPSFPCSAHPFRWSVDFSEQLCFFKVALSQKVTCPESN
ncbi:MAG: hypothetical protein KGJ78_18250 [Alphaproteobacteria bacterium]|nr:hypothetical protein [Alphaproteobacteria bacterium]